MVNTTFEVPGMNNSRAAFNNYNTVTMVRGAEESDHVQVLSDYGRLVFEVVNFVTISSVIGLFGICSNIINIIVFIK